VGESKGSVARFPAPPAVSEQSAGRLPAGTLRGAGRTPKQTGPKHLLGARDKFGSWLLASALACTKGQGTG